MSAQEIQDTFEKLGLGATAFSSAFTGMVGSTTPPKVEIVVSTNSNPFS